MKRDRVAGAAFIAAAVAIGALSTDLPFGTLSAPGAGMLPISVLALMAAFGAVLLARGGSNAGFSRDEWRDLPHAARVIAAAAAAAALYTGLGFLLTVSLLLFVLTFAVERRPLARAAAFSLAVTEGSYALFTYALRTPLPRGLLGF